MSLYIAAKRTKLGINLSLGLIIFIILFKGFWNVALIVYNKYNPPEIPPAEAAYGKIPKLRMKSLPLKGGSKPRYRLETTTGSLPLFPDRAPVYKLRDRATSISLEKNAVNFAASLGFTGQRVEVDQINWSWTDEANSRTMNINIFTQDFEVDTDLEKVAPTVPRGSAPTPEEAVNRTRSFLDTYLPNDRFLQEDEDLATFSTRLIQIRGNKPAVVEIQSEAQMVEVNFHIVLKSIAQDYPGFSQRFLQKAYPVVSNDPDVGVIQVYVTRSPNSSYTMPIIKFSSQRLNENERSTYPIIRIDTAWEKLANGEGTISFLRIKGDDPLTTYIPLNISEVQIRSIKLAYLDTGLPYRQYLQPIYVFEGEAFTKEDLRARYVAYLPAVSPRCLGESTDLGKPCI